MATDSSHRQGSKIVLVHSYLRVPKAAGQVKILIFLVKIKYFPIYANSFCDAGQVPIFRYFKACLIGYNWKNLVSTLALLFFIGSSLFLQVTMTAIKALMCSKFCKIGPGSAELATLECLKKSP